VQKYTVHRPQTQHNRSQRYANDLFREYLANHDITIPVRELSWLREKALRKWRHRNPEAVVEDPVPQEFLNWITVTWIRHQCTEYDATLRWFSPCIREHMRTKLKKHVLYLIAETYPELAEACAQQLQNIANETKAHHIKKQ
jgi:hypothetical protein